VANYTDLGGAGFGRAIAVTALMTAVILLGQLTFSVLAAYAFGRLEFPGRDALFWVYIATMMVPGTVTVVPLYLMMAQMGLRNTFWALVLPFMFGSPYAIFLLREHFRIIPNDLINAAGPGRVDPDHRGLAVEQLHVAAGDHQRQQVAGAHGGDVGPADPVQLAMDAGDGGDHRRNRAVDRTFRGRPATHRRVDRGLGAQVSRLRAETAVRAAIFARSRPPPQSRRTT
jgi:hypothetical protein